VFVKINGTTHYLWRAVDQHGNVLDILVQSRRNAVAAKRFFRKLLKRQCTSPRVLVTDKLRSYQVAQRAVMPSVEHRQSRYLNSFILSSLGPGHHLGNLIGAARVLTSGVLSVWVAGYRTLGRAPC
jgi:transposase-like protein